MIGLADGSIAARACTNMALIFQLEGNSKPVWSIVNLGRSCFMSGGEDGNMILWKVARALPDKI